jgi:hypothetical protein
VRDHGPFALLLLEILDAFIRRRKESALDPSKKKGDREQNAYQDDRLSVRLLIDIMFDARQNDLRMSDIEHKLLY